MSKQEIENYNRLCAEFLELELAGPGFPSGYFYNEEYYHFEDLVFHSDWNWIMKVIESIEKLDISKNKFSAHPFYQGFNLENNTYYTHLQYGEDLQFNGESSSSKKEAVVQAINQFLIWYNSKKLEKIKSQ